MGVDQIEVTREKWSDFNASFSASFFAGFPMNHSAQPGRSKLEFLSYPWSQNFGQVIDRSSFTCAECDR
jgi:hypothetical protein